MNFIKAKATPQTDGVMMDFLGVRALFKSKESFALEGYEVIFGIRPEFFTICDGGRIHATAYSTLPASMETTVKVHLNGEFISSVVFGAIDFKVDQPICCGIELRWDWVRFLKVGADGDHVHYLVQSTPDHSPAEIVRLIKGMTAKRIFAEHPEVKRMLWGGEFWSDGYFVSTVGKITSEDVISEYVRSQGKEKDYKQLWLNL